MNEMEMRIAELEMENKKLKDRLELANKLFKEKEEDVKRAGRFAIAKACRNLVHAKDFIYVMGTMFQDLRVICAEGGEAKLTETQVNNCIEYIELIVTAMEENGLYSEDDVSPKPDFTTSTLFDIECIDANGKFHHRALYEREARTVLKKLISDPDQPVRVTNRKTHAMKEYGKKLSAEEWKIKKGESKW